MSKRRTYDVSWWSRPLSPSNGSTAETIPRRLRTVANMPVRGT